MLLLCYELRVISFLKHICVGVITSCYFTITFWKKSFFHSLGLDLEPVAEKRMS